MAALAHEQEFRQGIFRLGSGKIECVVKLRHQVALDGGGLVEVGIERLHDLLCESRDARVEWRQLQVGLQVRSWARRDNCRQRRSGFDQSGFGLIKADGVDGIEIVECPGTIGADRAVHAIESLRAWGEEKDVCANGLHQNAVMNSLQSFRAEVWIAGCELKAAVLWAKSGQRLGRVRPCLAVELAESNATPFQVMRTTRIAVDFNVHHDRAGLLNLPDLAKLHVITESRGEICSARI